MKGEKGRGEKRVEEIGGRGKESRKGESWYSTKSSSHRTMWPDELWAVYKPFQTHRLML